MKKKMMAVMLALVGAALVTACVASAPPAPTPHASLEKLEDGIYSMPPGSNDELLNMDKYGDARVVIIPGDLPNVSDAHIAALRDWVSKGGTVWVQEPALSNAALSTLVAINQQNFKFAKTATGKNGGELVVKDKVPRLKINDDPLTEGVEKLYVYPKYAFDGTPGLIPLLEMTDTEGHHGTVIGAVKIGEGRVVLDGTAHTEGSAMARLPGFSVDHPNAEQQGNQWNSYDWDKLIANARDLSDRAMGEETGSSGS